MQDVKKAEVPERVGPVGRAPAAALVMQPHTADVEATAPQAEAKPLRTSFSGRPWSGYGGSHDGFSQHLSIS
jgi:hypothetical protein